ncbi:hypothetical protein LINPERHAP1_LOCUS37479, partial [Linum perenne]
RRRRRFLVVILRHHYDAQLLSTAAVVSKPGNKKERTGPVEPKGRVTIGKRLNRSGSVAVVVVALVDQ